MSFNDLLFKQVTKMEPGEQGNFLPTKVVFSKPMDLRILHKHVVVLLQEQV